LPPESGGIEQPENLISDGGVRGAKWEAIEMPTVEYPDGLLIHGRARQWIKLPDNRISRTASGEYLVLGPCELTQTGREALDRDRRLGPRGHESD
jgi:hypothetical protein